MDTSPFWLLGSETHTPVWTITTMDWFTKGQTVWSPIPYSYCLQRDENSAGSTTPCGRGGLVVNSKGTSCMMACLGFTGMDCGIHSQFPNPAWRFGRAGCICPWLHQNFAEQTQEWFLILLQFSNSQHGSSALFICLITRCSPSFPYTKPKHPGVVAQTQLSGTLTAVPPEEEQKCSAYQGPGKDMVLTICIDEC